MIISVVVIFGYVALGSFVSCYAVDCRVAPLFQLSTIADYLSATHQFGNYIWLTLF